MHITPEAFNALLEDIQSQLREQQQQRKLLLERETMISKKYPTHGESRPYSFNPFEPATEPKWFAKYADYYPLHCISAYMTALENFVAGMPSEVLKDVLAEATSESTYAQHPINCDLTVDNEILVETLKAEVAYRQEVDAKQKLLVN
jgi:hypothetical protein